VCLARVELLGDETDQPLGSLTDIARIDRTPEGARLTDSVGVVSELGVEIGSVDFTSCTVRLHCHNRAPTTE